jgi:hypothetical protein
VIVQILTADLGWVALLQNGMQIQVAVWALDEEGPPIYKEKYRVVRGMCVSPTAPPPDGDTGAPYHPLVFCDEAYPSFVGYVWTGKVPTVTNFPQSQ